MALGDEKTHTNAYIYKLLHLNTLRQHQRVYIYQPLHKKEISADQHFSLHTSQVPIYTLTSSLFSIKKDRPCYKAIPCHSIADYPFLTLSRCVMLSKIAWNKCTLDTGSLFANTTIFPFYWEILLLAWLGLDFGLLYCLCK